MTSPFSRSISARSGVQLNYIDDQSEQPSTDTVANNMAITGRFARGRIDKVFAVSKGKEKRLLGAPVSLSVSRLGEPYVHIYEALRKGTVQAIVSRLVSATAKNQLMVCTAANDQSAVWSMVDESVGASGSYLFAIKHLECFSDGVIAEVHANIATDTTGAQVASKIVSLQLRDVITNLVILGPYVGSLDPAAQDEFGQSYYIADIVHQSTDVLQVVDVADGATVPTSCYFYGKASSKDVYASQTLSYFTEGPTTYTTDEMDAAIDRIRKSKPSFTYIGSGGTENVALISRLLDLGLLINKQVAWDILGSLTPDAAIIFYDSIGSSADSLYSQCYWAPFTATNPAVGGNAYIGTSGQNIGFRCTRNAQTNAKGIAPRNVVIAGSDYGVDRTSIVQQYEMDDDAGDYENLAVSRINPVVYVDYASGGKYAWYDSLTGAQTTGASKLIAVAEMATYVDDTIASAAQESLQKPMATAIKTMTTFITNFLGACQSASYFQASTVLDGAMWSATIAENSADPFEKMNINTYICYDGTNRITEQQQTIVRT